MPPREERLKRLMEVSRDILFELDLEGTWIYCSPALKPLTGVDPEDILGHKCFELFPPELRPKISALFASVVQGTPVEGAVLPWVGADGTRGFLECHSAPIREQNRVVGVQGILRDVTVRIETEQRLRESERVFRSILEGVNLIAVQLDLRGRIVFCNEYLLKLTGWTGPEAVGGDWFGIFLPAGVRDTVREMFHGTMQNATMPLHYENTITTRSGEERMVRWNNILMRDAAGTVIGVSSIGEDITEQERTAEELARVRDGFQSIVETSPSGILVVDLTGPVLYRNKTSGIMLGGRAPSPDWLGLADGEVRHVGITRLNSEPGIGLLSVSLTRWNGLPARLYFVRDVTDLVRTEAEADEVLRRLFQAQKLQDLNQMAGGLAHDFNNLLTAVLGYSELLMERLSASDPNRNHAEEIHKAGQRASVLSRKLLALSRHQVLLTRPVHLNTLIQGMAEMMKSLVGENIRLELRLDPADPVVLADHGQLEQVLLNLMLNSRDAISGKGTIEVGSGALAVTGAMTEVKPDAAPGRYGFFWVADNGPGIVPEIRSRLFEPFFTTKTPGAGTGLGLSVVNGIVRQHNGWVDVRSDEGKGARFRIFIPATVNGNDSPVPAPVPAADLSGSGPRLLLVEDDPDLLKLISRVMEEHGYRIVPLPDAETALALFREDPGGFDLVFSDVILPGMDGLMLADELRTLAPSLPVLLTSGYAEERIHAAVIQRRGYALLHKPYVLSEMFAAIRSTLSPQT